MIVYCPWCGEIKTLLCYGWVTDPINQIKTLEYEWFPCSKHLCRGAFITLVTDVDGFVIHPYHARGQYVLKRPEKKDGKRKINSRTKTVSIQNEGEDKA